MSRFPPTPHDKLPEELKLYSQDFEDDLPAFFGQNGELMTYRDDNGAVIGPYPILIHSKEVGRSLMNVVKKFPTLGKIPEDAKEVAIITVGARFDCAYELYAHKLHGIKRAGLTQEQVDKLAIGQKPDGLSAEASLAYDATHYLANKPGPLPQHLFDACEKTFGRDGTLLLIHNTAMYCYVCVLLNAAAAPLPKGETQ